MLGGIVLKLEIGTNFRRQTMTEKDMQTNEFHSRLKFIHSIGTLEDSFQAIVLK